MPRGTTALVSFAVVALVGCGTDDVAPISAPETSETSASGSVAGDPPSPAPEASSSTSPMRGQTT